MVRRYEKLHVLILLRAFSLALIVKLHTVMFMVAAIGFQVIDSISFFLAQMLDLVEAVVETCLELLPHFFG